MVNLLVETGKRFKRMKELGSIEWRRKEKQNGKEVLMDRMHKYVY